MATSQGRKKVPNALQRHSKTNIVLLQTPNRRGRCRRGRPGDRAAEVLEGRIPFQGERIYLICFWIDHNENTNELEYHGF